MVRIDFHNFTNTLVKWQSQKSAVTKRCYFICNRATALFITFLGQFPVKEFVCFARNVGQLTGADRPWQKVVSFSGSCGFFDTRALHYCRSVGHGRRLTGALTRCVAAATAVCPLPRQALQLMPVRNACLKIQKLHGVHDIKRL